MNLGEWSKRAADAGLDDHVWRLAWRLRLFFDISLHPDDALGTARLGVAAAERTGDLRARYVAWNTLGSAENIAGRADAAGACVERALELAQQAGDPAAESGFRANLSVTWWIRGDLDAAPRGVTLAREAAERWDAGSDELMRPGWQRILRNLGGIHLLLGNLELAKTHTEEALRLARRRADWYSEAEALTNLAEVYVRAADDVYANEALARLDGLQTPGVAFDLLAVRARVAARAGRHDEARDLGRQALALLPPDDPRAENLPHRPGLPDQAAPTTT